MNAKIDRQSVTPNDLARIIRELTGQAADGALFNEIGPGLIYVIEFPGRRLCYLSTNDKSFPNSFHSMASDAENWDEMIISADREAYVSSWQDDEIRSEFEYNVLVTRRGNKQPIREYRSLLINSEGTAVGAICRIVDDSFRSMAMDALIKRSWKEIATKMTRRFLHDFNNTIAGIYSLSELYAEPGADAKSMTEAMEHIRVSSIRSQEITRKIRQLTTLENGEPSYFNLEKLVKEQEEYMQALLPKGVSIEYELEGKEIPIYIDANQFRQAILHLTSNAYDAAGEKVEIRIRVYSPGNSGQPNMARVDFSDNGTGILEADLENVFRPFFTTKDTSTHPGLGLNIIKTFVENSNGTIELDRLEHGTSVSIYFPTAGSEPSFDGTESSIPAKTIEKAAEKTDDTPLELLVYTWEDITRHPLLQSMRDANWNFRIHLDPGQLLIDLSQSKQGLDGVLIFKSALDERVEPLLSELGHAKSCPKIGVIALGESVDAMPESIKRNCELIISGSSKPLVLLNKLAKFYR